MFGTGPNAPGGEKPPERAARSGKRGLIRIEVREVALY